MDVPRYVINKAKVMIHEKNERKKNKPAGKPCEKCQCIIDPRWLDIGIGVWIQGHVCKDCKKREEVERKNELSQLTNEEQQCVNDILQREQWKRDNRNNSDIHGELRWMTFDAFKDGGTVYDYAKKYAEDGTEGGLYIFGAVGSGKTHLSCAIGNHLLDNTTSSVKFIKAIDLLFNARDFNANTNEAKVINELNEFEVLILDDLGTEKLSEWAIQVIYKLIDDRMLREYYPLIVIPNVINKSPRFGTKR